MDRQGIIAVSLAVFVLIGWTVYNGREVEKAAAARRAAAAEIAKNAPASPSPTPVESSAVATPGANAPATGAAAVEPATPAIAAQTLDLKGPKVDYTFTNLGGGIARAVLLTHEAERGKRMVINEFGAIPIGAVTEVAGDGVQIPFTETHDESRGVVTYQRTDARQLQTTKTFTIARAGGDLDDYAAKLEVAFTNRADEPIALPAYYVHTGAAAPVHDKDLSRYIGLKASNGKFVDVTWFSGGGFLMFSHPPRPVYTETRQDIAWLGSANQYFTTLISPLVSATDPAGQTKQLGNSVWGSRFEIADDLWKESDHATEGSQKRYAVQGALGMPGFTLKPGQSSSQTFTIYTGPREYSRLKKLGSTEEEIMDFGMFGFVSKTLLNGMNWLHAHLGSYAAAIVVLTLIIKSLLWPLQNKATNSMKRAQLLQPKMTELREKYKEDPARMNTEVMKLYKDYGVNPVGGCLPMLIQIPIFFGFYNMLGKAVELRNSHFLWIHDLSQPDTVLHLGSFPVNVLPIVMAGTMFWQMSISPKTGDPAQQRMFMFMPLMFVFFCYNYASALALYWAVQNLFSVAQLYVTRKQAPPQLTRAPKKK